MSWHVMRGANEEWLQTGNRKLLQFQNWTVVMSALLCKFDFLKNHSIEKLKWMNFMGCKLDFHKSASNIYNSRLQHVYLLEE